METAIGLVAFLATVAASGGLARRYGVPAPLMLVVLGIAASYLPLIGPVRITPDVILIGLLPLSLYAAAVETSLIDFRANLRPIAHPVMRSAEPGEAWRWCYVDELLG